MLCLVITTSGEEHYEHSKEEPGAAHCTKNHTGGLDGSEVHGDGKIFSSHDKLSGFFKSRCLKLWRIGRQS